MTGWELLAADLLTYLPTLSGLTESGSVSRGQSDSRGQLLNFATVGDDGDGNGGFYEQSHDAPGVMTQETGTVLVRLVSRSGDPGLVDRSTTANGWVDALRARFASQAFKVAGPLPQGSSVSVGRVDVRAVKSKQGAAMDLLAAVNYTTFQ